MRRLVVPVLIAALAGTALVGCSSTASAGAACEAPAVPDASVFEKIEVDGPVGGTTTFDAYTPLVVESTTWEHTTPGEGTPITASSQVLQVELSFFRGSDGTPLSLSGAEGPQSVTVPLSGLVSSIPALADAMQCARPGSRVVTIAAPDDIAEQFSSAVGLGASESLAIVADVGDVLLAKADGADQFVDGRGLPSVVRAADGRPGISVPDGDAPEEIRVEVLKKGSGATIDAETPAVVAYTSVSWNDREVVTTTWDATPDVASADSLGADVMTALDGRTVGSQILVVVPPAADDTAGSALVYVVDILGVLPS